eukprot:1184340-Rhodomonas_salina.1
MARRAVFFCLPPVNTKGTAFFLPPVFAGSAAAFSTPVVVKGLGRVATEKPCSAMRGAWVWVGESDEQDEIENNEMIVGPGV